MTELQYQRCRRVNFTTCEVTYLLEFLVTLYYCSRHFHSHSGVFTWGGGLGFLICVFEAGLTQACWFALVAGVLQSWVMPPFLHFDLSGDASAWFQSHPAMWSPQGRVGYEISLSKWDQPALEQASHNSSMGQRNRKDKKVTEFFSGQHCCESEGSPGQAKTSLLGSTALLMSKRVEECSLGGMFAEYKAPKESLMLHVRREGLHESSYVGVSFLHGMWIKAVARGP